MDSSIGLKDSETLVQIGKFAKDLRHYVLSLGEYDYFGFYMIF
jgi:hypothetical protein